MKALTLLAVVAIASLVSCSGISPGAQAKIDQASSKYESATGITPVQTASLLGKWWTDFQQEREINKLLKTEPILYRDQGTSAKAVRAVQASRVAPAAEPDAAPPGAQSPAARNHTSLVAYQVASDRRCRGSYGRPSQAQAAQAEAKQSS